jgi:hypothetical protein
MTTYLDCGENTDISCDMLYHILKYSSYDLICYLQTYDLMMFVRKIEVPWFTVLVETLNFIKRLLDIRISCELVCSIYLLIIYMFRSHILISILRPPFNMYELMI